MLQSDSTAAPYSLTDKRLEAGTVFIFLIALEVDFDKGDGLDVWLVNIDDAQTAVGAAARESPAGELADFAGGIFFSAESFNRQNTVSLDIQAVKRFNGVCHERFEVTFQRSETLQQLLEVPIKTWVIHVMHQTTFDSGWTDVSAVR